MSSYNFESINAVAWAFTHEEDALMMYEHEFGASVQQTGNTNFTLDYYTPRKRSSGGYIEITLSVCPSVCEIPVRPITFLWFDIGLPYLAHGCITMR